LLYEFPASGLAAFEDSSHLLFKLLVGAARISRQKPGSFPAPNRRLGPHVDVHCEMCDENMEWDMLPQLGMYH